MKIRVAVTSSDGKAVDLHFGRCSDFRIAEIDSGTGEWRFVEDRRAEQTCRGFAHREEHVKEVVELLADCSFLLTYRIGIYPYSLFRSRGVTCFETPTEEPETINAALRDLRNRLAARPPSPGEDPDSTPGAERTERKGIDLE